MIWSQPQSRKTCPRCGTAFECHVDDLAHCDCIAVKTPVSLLEQLKEEYPDCICSTCLRELADAKPAAVS